MDTLRGKILKLKAKKLLASMKNLLKYRRQENLTLNFLDYSTLYINKNTMEKEAKDCIFLAKATSESLIAIAVKIYISLLCNHIWPEVTKILGKNLNKLSEKSIHNFSDSDYLSDRRVSAKISKQHFVLRCFQGIWFLKLRRERTNTTSM